MNKKFYFKIIKGEYKYYKMKKKYIYLYVIQSVVFEVIFVFEFRYEWVLFEIQFFEDVV